LAPTARRVSSIASRLPGTTSLRFAFPGWQRQSGPVDTAADHMPDISIQRGEGDQQGKPRNTQQNADTMGDCVGDLLTE
ncbi:MAG: hypothetical protein ABW068_01490, partial [Candidatus Thiodiazotropha sp.]